MNKRFVLILSTLSGLAVLNAYAGVTGTHAPTHGGARIAPPAASTNAEEGKSSKKADEKPQSQQSQQNQ